MLHQPTAVQAVLVVLSAGAAALFAIVGGVRETSVAADESVHWWAVFPRTLPAVGLAVTAAAVVEGVAASVDRVPLWLAVTGLAGTVAVLALRPTYLTRLSTTKGSTFPTIRVVKRIDGREPLVSHGSPMPIYGEFFEPVVNLVVWLEGTQDLRRPGSRGCHSCLTVCRGGRCGFRPDLSPTVVQRVLKQSALLHCKRWLRTVWISA